MRQDLDEVLDALMVDSQDPDADPWAAIAQARDLAYKLRADFDYQGVYVPFSGGAR